MGWYYCRMKLRLSRLSTAATIIALVVIILFVLSVPHAREVPRALKQNAVPAEAPTVTLRDNYKKGVHTLSGEVTAPDACTRVTAMASIVGDAANPRGIMLALTMPASSGVCLTIRTQSAFSAAISAPASLPISVTLNGVSASTTSTGSGQSTTP